MQHPKKRTKNSGFALVTVLWEVVILSIIVLAFSADTRTETTMVRNTIELAQAKARAQGGINLAIYGLLDPNPETKWQPDMEPHDVLIDGQMVTITVQDEGGKFDLNSAPKEILEKLFAPFYEELEIDISLADAVMDWRDYDDLKELNGAEKTDYLEAGLEYRAKNAPFDSIDELRLVLGVTDEIFTMVQPAITVYSQQPEPDQNTASELVLSMMLDMDDIALEEIINQRDISAENGDTFMHSIVNVFTIQATAQNEFGPQFIQRAVVHLTGNLDQPYKIYEIGRGKNTEAEDEEVDFSEEVEMEEE
ncbi:MAG: general secretion pathway protein GspK [Magnetococcales bacterium]|nr:general secretion pathway protein GspK [Magnetococcales bacterium]